MSRISDHPLHVKRDDQPEREFLTDTDNLNEWQVLSWNNLSILGIVR